MEIKGKRNTELRKNEREWQPKNVNSGGGIIGSEALSSPVNKIWLKQ